MQMKQLRLILGAAVSAAFAGAILAGGTIASHSAQIGTGNFSVGPRAPTVTMRSPSSPNFGGGAGLRTEPRLQRLRDHHDNTVSDDEPKSKGKSDGARRPTKRPIHVGPIIGTGVAIGTLGPAGAGPSGSPPPGGVAAARIYLPPAGEDRFVNDEVLLEFAVRSPDTAPLLRRHRLVQLESQFFTLSNSTIVRARITDGRLVRAVLQTFIGEATVRTAQPNMLFRSSQGSPAQGVAAPEAGKVTPAVAAAGAIPAGGDPAQYVLSKLHLGEAHTLANGDRVVVAVIDSGIDMDHPDLAGAFAGSYDAIGKPAPPHQHGTAIAGAIVAHARLMGAAPAAKILAIRAFGPVGASAEGTGMAVRKGVEYASVQQARVINMSFAGPNDPGLARVLAVAKAKGAVLVAASGNFGPKSSPQYPAADPNVIAVSATDPDDKLFAASNIGPHIAVAAPGVDILLPSPGGEYRLISGTSFSAAYVSGVAALVLQRAPALSPDQVRTTLQGTAKDLGPVGKDPEFGFGLVDAYAAIMAVQASGASAVLPPAGVTEQAKAQ
jgi:subtilisin family serine protease